MALDLQATAECQKERAGGGDFRPHQVPMDAEQFPLRSSGGAKDEAEG